MTGKVLVVLPTLGDRLTSLRIALESVSAQRREVDLTLVVVLPESADAAREMARSYSALLVTDPMNGISGAINLGISAATDEIYYAWIGDDDLFLPGALKLLKNLMENGDSPVVTFGACHYVTPDGERVRTSAAGNLARWILPWGPNPIPHPGSMIRLDALQSVGLFDESLRYAMDLDVFLKLRRIGAFSGTRTPVSSFGYHSESLTVAQRFRSGDEAQAIKRAHLPGLLRPISPLWSSPIKWLGRKAAQLQHSTSSTIRQSEEQTQPD